MSARLSRREFLGAASALALAPRALGAQVRPRFADMHSHIAISSDVSSFREFMAKGNMLLVAEKVIPDGLWIKLGKRHIARDGMPGQPRKNFDLQFGRVSELLRKDELATVSSVETLDRVMTDATPAVALASEGAEFLEGDLGYLEKVRADGLVMLQLMHERISDIGDVSIESPRHGGLTAFGKDVVRTCNRLGILVDVAECTSAGIEQVLEASSKPIVYSHGHVSPGAPRASQGGIRARGIHAPLAKHLAEKGGVIGLWPLRTQYADLAIYANELAHMVQVYGAKHVGIGTDMFGLSQDSVMLSYAEYAALPGHLARRGLKPDEIEAVLGGNFLRVLREALA